jgi:hypothetical protein
MKNFKIGSIDKKGGKSNDKTKSMTPKGKREKENFIENEFIKLFKERYFSKLEEGHYVFIKSYIIYDILIDFSSYGEKLIELDFSDYLTKDDLCFFCYIDFDIDFFIEDTIDFYNYILNN